MAGERTVIGLFDHRDQAEQAVRVLLDAGFRQGDISVTMQDKDEMRAMTEATGTQAAEGAGAGAVAGTVLGGIAGLLVGAGLLVIPGLGPILAAGPFAAAIGSAAAIAGAAAAGAGIGAAAGGLVGALVGLGVPEEEANVYAEGVRRGGILLLLRTADDEEYDRAKEVMRRNGATDVEARAGEYRMGGWRAFDPDTAGTVGVSEAARDDIHHRREAMRQDPDQPGLYHEEKTEPVISSVSGTYEGERPVQDTSATVGNRDLALDRAGVGEVSRSEDPTLSARRDRMSREATTDTYGASGTYEREEAREVLEEEADRNAGAYERSSKIGTTAGGLAGAATGAAIGAAGGPAGAIVGGVAGAVVGGGLGASGDALGERAVEDEESDNPDRRSDITDNNDTADYGGVLGTTRAAGSGHSSTDSDNLLRPDSTAEEEPSLGLQDQGMMQRGVDRAETGVDPLNRSGSDLSNQTGARSTRGGSKKSKKDREI
jgi:hypothetical protein